MLKSKKSKKPPSELVALIYFKKLYLNKCVKKASKSLIYYKNEMYMKIITDSKQTKLWDSSILDFCMQ